MGFPPALKKVPGASTRCFVAGKYDLNFNDLPPPPRIMLIYTTLNWLNLPQKDLSEAKKYIQKWLQCRKARVFFLSTRANICPIAGFSPSDALVQIRDIHGRRCGLCHAGRARIDLLFPLKKSRWETKPPVNVMWCMPWYLTQIDFHTFVEKFTLDVT